MDPRTTLDRTLESKTGIRDQYIGLGIGQESRPSFWHPDKSGVLEAKMLANGRKKPNPNTFSVETEAVTRFRSGDYVISAKSCPQLEVLCSFVGWLVNVGGTVGAL